MLLFINNKCANAKTMQKNFQGVSKHYIPTLFLSFSLSSLWEGLEWPHVGRQRLAVAPGRRAGAVAHSNPIAGGREAVWFIPQLQQMAATEVCLSSLHSRAGCQDKASHTQEEEEGAGSWTHARRMFSDSGCLTTPLTPFQPHTHTKPHISQTCTHIFSLILQHMYISLKTDTNTFPPIDFLFCFIHLSAYPLFVASTFCTNNHIHCDTHTSSTLIRWVFSLWRC